MQLILFIDGVMKLIAASTTKPADTFTQAFRVVLRLDSNNKHTPYVVHVETNPGTPKSGYVYGDYCENLLEATEAYVIKCKRHGVRALDAQGFPLHFHTSKASTL